MSNISSIDYFINTYKNNEETKNIKNEILEEEIEDIFNNILTETCYIYYDSPAITYNIIGIGETINLSDFTFLIPNLFRACYAQENAQIPYICPTYVNPSNTVNYFPTFIDTDLIKSFLYFNFPGSIKNFNNNYNFINSINTYINLKNIYSTYASNTSPVDIINTIYSPNSLLLQLYSFNTYLNNSNFADDSSLLTNNYTIGWDFTKSCVTYTEPAINIFTTGNFTVNNVILNQTVALNLYNIRNSLLYFYKTQLITTNGFIILQKYSIYTILDIVTEVYENIVEEIQYYFQKKNYCKKSYMYKYNIPVLLKIYKNYYNNQIYTISKKLSTANLFTIIPDVINIKTYVDEFISIYAVSFRERYLVKVLYLESGKDALVFFNNLSDSWFNCVGGTPILYYYYYINIANPSAIELYNFYNSIKYSSLYGSPPAFFETFNSTYPYKLSKSIIYNTYGLFPEAGGIIPNCNGIVGYYINSSGLVQSILFFTLISTIVTVDGSGNVIEDSYPAPGIVLQYYQNV